MHTVASGDRVKLRKKHPCGSDEWIVFRVGADMGLRCAGCDRHILMPRSQFDKQLKQVLSSTPDEEKETK